MSKYNLQLNEAFILSSEYVHYGNTNGELVLTNLNIVYTTSKGIFRTAHITEQYPIKQIKVLNGKPQVFVGKEGKINIHFMSGIKTFKFYNMDTLFSIKKAEKEAEKWLNTINQLITGQVNDVNISSNYSGGNSEIIVGSIKETLDKMKGAIGGKTNNNNSNQTTTQTSKKCIFCGAPILGWKGQLIQCQYCDGNQEL